MRVKINGEDVQVTLNTLRVIDSKLWRIHPGIEVIPDVEHEWNPDTQSDDPVRGPALFMRIEGKAVFYLQELSQCPEPNCESFADRPGFCPDHQRAKPTDLDALLQDINLEGFDLKNI